MLLLWYKAILIIIVINLLKMCRSDRENLKINIIWFNLNQIIIKTEHKYSSSALVARLSSLQLNSQIWTHIHGSKWSWDWLCISIEIILDYTVIIFRWVCHFILCRSFDCTVSGGVRRASNHLRHVQDIWVCAFLTDRDSYPANGSYHCSISFNFNENIIVLI